MAGAEAQAGFYYQNVVAAGYVLDLIEFGSPLRAVTLESEKQAKHIDDIVADYMDRTTFVQVKWAQDQTSALTLHNLVTAEGDSAPLLAKLVRGYRQVDGQTGQKEIILFSSRRTGINRQPGLGFDKSLTEFLDEFHRPFVEGERTVDVKRLVAFNDYKPILNALAGAADLPDFDEFLTFLKCVRFKLNQPDIDTMTGRIRTRLTQLGIEQRYYATLLDEIVKWSITRKRVTSDDVRRVLGIHDRFVDRVSHNFPFDKRVWVPTPDVFAELDSAIETLESGFILLEGEPGSGKSTALASYIEEKSEISFGYYCFVPNDQTLANERLEREAFISSICIGLRNAFPHIEFPKPYANHTVQLLNEWLHALSAAKQRVVFVVDGLDHVDRKTRQSLVTHPLTAVLDADNLPSNVLIVLSSRYAEALPEAAVNHVNADRKRRVKMRRFEARQIRQFFELRGVILSDEVFQPVVDVSGGIPIYLEYLANRFGEMNRYEQEQYIGSVPSLRDDTIDAYHRQLWETCHGDEREVYILAILAARDEFTTPETLHELLNELGADSTLHAVHQTITRLRHVLRVSDAESVAIRHSSLAEFVSEQTVHLRAEVNQAIVAWYDQNPDSDDAWRNRLRHMWEYGRYPEILSICDDAWVRRAWERHRPIAEIQGNLNIAWRAASTHRDILEFIRVALMKQRVAIVSNNLEVSEVDVARLLLHMDRPKEALRKVWDGERCRCSNLKFAEFCLAYIAKVGRIPPDHIVRSGLGDELGPGANAETAKTWYQARSLITDPIGVLLEIGRMRWQGEKYHYAKRPISREAGEQTNLELQMAVLRNLVSHGRHDSLEQVHATETLPEPLRVAARGMRGLVLAQKNERSEALRLLDGLDLTCLPQSDQRWLLLGLAEVGLDRVLAASPARYPDLPQTLRETNEHEFNGAFLELYDTLRCFFRRDKTGFPWFETMMIGRPEPARTLLTAIGRLAQLWTNLIRGKTTEGSPFATIKDIASGLDLRRTLFQGLERNDDYTFSLYRKISHHLFNQAWSCAKLLSDTDLQELGNWWVTTEEGQRALCNPEATRALARVVHERQPAANVCRELLKIAEQSERADEETYVIGAGLFACASAWAECGFPDEARRLWHELLNVACGVHWRKDYQFNEVLTALALAHEDEPDGTLTRIGDQLALAHQLVGTARSKTVGVAIEDLIEFLSKIDPGLALEALHQEEALIYRERAIQCVIRGLLDDADIDLRLVFSIAATMGYWENYTKFDEHTNPAVFAVYSTALDSGDIATARSVYDLWRSVLLIEKQMPAELGRWAAKWVETDEAPPDVRNDYVEYPVPAKREHAQSTGSPKFDDDSSLSDELDALVHDLVGLEARLNEGTSQVLRTDRKRDLEHFQRDCRDAYARAAGKAWSENASRNFDLCFAEFVMRVLAVDFGERHVAKTRVRDAFCWLIDTVSEQLSCEVTYTAIEDFFDIEEWLDHFVRRSEPMPYTIQQILEGRLPKWISKVPLSDLNTWEDFCRRRCTDRTRAAALLALAQRYSAVDPSRAVGNLIASWECLPDFFHEYWELAQPICTKLLDLDEDRGVELLFESFRLQYERYPDMVIYRLDHLLKFANRLEPFNKVHLYEIWSSHNQHLAAGLSAKAVDISWLQDSALPDFRQACLKYLLRLFDYPVVDVRLLALDELFRLTTERPDTIPVVLNSWSSLSDGQKEYVVSLAFSSSLHKNVLAEQWLPLLVELGWQEQHRSLRVTIAEAVETATARGAALAPETIAAARGLKDPPCIVLPKDSVLHWKEPRRVWLPPYLRWSMKVIAEGANAGNLEVQTEAVLSQLYPHLDHSHDEEMAVHRAYNINTNFDTIEIGGSYDNAIRSALNRGIQILVNAHELDQDGLEDEDDVLRLRDPSDALVRKVQRPTQVCWIKEGISDEDFLAFHDLEDIKSGYALRDGDWVTLFEHTEQRTSDKHDSHPQRAAKIHVVAFGIPRDISRPAITDLRSEAEFLPRLRNRYRFELPHTESPRGRGHIIPLLVVTSRAFRGRKTPNMAALTPHIVTNLSLVRADGDLLGLVDRNQQMVVRSIEWQEAFDQGRRRHEPKSEGFLLQMKRDNLRRMAEQEKLHIYAMVSVKRTTDRYKPEYEMHWKECHGLFLLQK